MMYHHHQVVQKIVPTIVYSCRRCLNNRSSIQVLVPRTLSTCMSMSPKSAAIIYPSPVTSHNNNSNMNLTKKRTHPCLSMQQYQWYSSAVSDRNNSNTVSSSVATKKKKTNKLKKSTNQNQSQQQQQETKKKVVSLPPFMRITDFCKRLKLPKKAVMTHMGATRAKRRLQWEDPLTGRSFVFKKINQFVVPYDTMVWFLRDVLGKSKNELDIHKEDQWERTLRPLPNNNTGNSDNSHDGNHKKDEKIFIGRRRPVVAVLGHIDHGKTTIIDSLYGTRSAEQEAGGITQAIGAWPIPLRLHDQDDPDPDGVPQVVETTFLDTPGHVHFYQMREDSARVATAGLLVVASDEHELREQTIESINCLLDMDVPLVVAINKIDKKDANPKHTKAMLKEIGFLDAIVGGEKPSVVEISAKKKINLRLMEKKLAQAILRQNLLAYGDGYPAEGIVIEASNTRTQGALLRIVLSAGILRVGQPYVSGNVVGVVKTMYNEFGKEQLEEARPGQVVYVSGSLKGIGLSQVPPLGEPFFVLKDRKEAEQMVDYRKMIQELAGNQVAGPPLFMMAQQSHQQHSEKTTDNGKFDNNDIDDFEEEITDIRDVLEARDNEMHEEEMGLPIIVKAETAGKLDALLSALSETDCARPVRSSVGPLEVGEVEVASQEKIPVISYGLEVSKHVQRTASKKGVTIIQSMVMHDIVYAIVDHARKKGY